MLIELYDQLRVKIPNLKMTITGNTIVIKLGDFTIFSTTGNNSSDYAQTFLSGLLAGYNLSIAAIENYKH